MLQKAQSTAQLSRKSCVLCGDLILLRIHEEWA